MSKSADLHIDEQNGEPSRCGGPAFDPLEMHRPGTTTVTRPPAGNNGFAIGLVVGMELAREDAAAPATCPHCGRRLDEPKDIAGAKPLDLLS